MRVSRRWAMLVTATSIAITACDRTQPLDGDRSDVSSDVAGIDAVDDALPPPVECTQIPDGGSGTEATLRAVAMGREGNPDRTVQIDFILEDPPFDFTRLQTATGAEHDAIIAERVAQLAPSQDAVTARIVARGGVVENRLWITNMVVASMQVRYLIETPCYPSVLSVSVETNWYDVVARPWDVASVGTHACPMTMGACPSHCRTIHGLVVDATHACSSGDWIPVDCSVDEQIGGWGDRRCNALATSGALFVTMDESLAAPTYARWRACNTTEQDLVGRATAMCP